MIPFADGGSFNQGLGDWQVRHGIHMLLRHKSRTAKSSRILQAIMGDPFTNIFLQVANESSLTRSSDMRAETPKRMLLSSSLERMT
jgi:hypothetical protein